MQAPAQARGLEPSYVAVAPAQVTLQEGCSYSQATQQLEAVGLTFPLLVKPLCSTIPPGTHGISSSTGKGYAQEGTAE
jgi:hypothetical protein